MFGVSHLKDYINSGMQIKSLLWHYTGEPLTERANPQFNETDHRDSCDIRWSPVSKDMWGFHFVPIIERDDPADQTGDGFGNTKHTQVNNPASVVPQTFLKLYKRADVWLNEICRMKHVVY